MKKFSLLLCCFVALLVSQKVWADELANGTSGSFFLYEDGTPTSHSLNANNGDRALIGATTYESGKKWSQIEQSEIGDNVQYKEEQNWIINNADNGNVGDEVAVPNGQSTYQYYTKVVEGDQASAGTWTGPSDTAPSGMTSFIDINTNQIEQYKTENMGHGTYYYRVTVPLYDYYKRVRCWKETTLTGQHTITYYEVGTDVNSLAAPTSDEGKIAIGGDYWYVENGSWKTDANTNNGERISVSGCNVSINMAKAEGAALSTLITEAKSTVIAGGQTGICTLTVTGEVSNNDLAALGNSNMSGVTRIDLSGATLATGAEINRLNIPSSLISLVLPKDQTVSAGLATKLAEATNLEYAYSPSSDATTTFIIADYVWVNKAGGLNTAITNETSLRSSHYIKIASEVALNADDVNLRGDGNRLNNVEYIDMRNANLTTAVVASGFSAPHDNSHRIILPDGWSGDDMATFGARSFSGIAAVYSYTGSKLNILELHDQSYSPTALANDRIVYDGTTAIEVVKGTYNNLISNFGDNLLAAINAAKSSINSVTISTSSVPLTETNNTRALTFTNTNITSLSVLGVVDNRAALNADALTGLTSLNLTGSTLKSIDASVANLTSVNLSGTTVEGTTDLSYSGINTVGFTTNSSTKFQGDLNLMSTALTSFATSAEIGTTTANTGNIYLNGTTTLTSINVANAQFKNSESMIHVDKSTTENSGNTDALDGLTTIQVPSGFASSTRIHPYSEVESIITQAATTGEMVLGDGCKIEYNSSTGVATVTATHAGCFSKLMAQNNNYSKFPSGTTFKFTSTCNLNENDLKSLCGYINEDGVNVNDQAYRSNYYYVDLYDVPQSSALCHSQTSVITNTINWMRTNDRQFKGLILPKDHTVYGKGISLIQSENANTSGELSTCSEFIAYYKTKEIKEGDTEPTNLTKTILFTHVYNAQSNYSVALQTNNNKLTELLTTHGLNGAGANAADLYSVSTNSVSSLDYSALVGSKGYIETFNNEMVGAPTTASIYAHPSTAGEFTTFVNSSSIGVTPTEVLKIHGTVSNNASAVAASLNNFTNGPRVLDLSKINPNDDTFLGNLLAGLTNSHIEYIILPANKPKSLVCGTTYNEGMTNLKAVISSSTTNLVAYVNVPGSLAEARCLATGGSTTPTTVGLTSVTLSGSLNASDICVSNLVNVGGDGHYQSHVIEGTGNVAGLNEESGIKTIDLTDAVFPTQTDMNFHGLGLTDNARPEVVKLPTSEAMTDIPAECFKDLTSLTGNYICIPYNFKNIGDDAFKESEIYHITTTDRNLAEIDNGMNTITLSANLLSIGERAFRLKHERITDVYVLAKEAPTCKAQAFGDNSMYYGNGGHKEGDKVYCRELYIKNDADIAITVLHYPDGLTKEQEAKYTDVTKVYTKKDQTGAVDGNGNPLLWPTRKEMNRAFNQATTGYLWDEWVKTLDGQGEIEVMALPSDKPDKSATCSFKDYIGWHQFVLSKATYVPPVESNKDERNYKDDKWFTFCIPFDMTESEVIKLLGLPMSEDPNVVNKYNDAEITSNVMPQIYTLKQVTRNLEGTAGTITLIMSDNLAVKKDGNYTYYNPTTKEYEANSHTSVDNNRASDPVVIRAGYPYLIKAYKRDNEAIVSPGLRVMKRYAFSKVASAAYRTETRIMLGGTHNNGTAAAYQSPFAIPFTGHEVLAMFTQDNSAAVEAFYTEGSTAISYKYKFMGQYWQQPLPLNSYYVAQNKWWYYKTYRADYLWKPYQCVVNVSSVLDNTNSTYFEEIGMDAGGGAIFKGELHLEYTGGHDDTFVDNENQPASVRIVFDDIITEYDSEGNEVTVIQNLDGQDITPMKSIKVYDMKGQYVGHSVNGLRKGLYIVDGKKVVVD